jgi:hypothetical protein
MNDEKKILKDDINFLEYPNWIASKKSNLKSWSVEKPHGKYEMISAFGLPKHFDKIILYFLLYKLYQENNLHNYTVVTSRYEIAKNVFSSKNPGKKAYESIMKALKRWKTISIFFDGIFYGGDGHTIRGFAFIDSYVLQKNTGELKIRFNEDYINHQRDSQYYKLVDLEQYKKLHKESSMRLYEILVKTFYDRDEWSINIQALAEKMTFEKRKGAKEYFVSDVLRYLKPGVNEINKKIDTLAVAFAYNKETGTCIFKKQKKPKEHFLAATRAEDKPKKNTSLARQVSACMEQFRSLPADEQKKILDDIKKQPYSKFLPDDEARIFTYMTKISTTS